MDCPPERLETDRSEFEEITRFLHGSTMLTKRPYIGVRFDGDPGQNDHSRKEPKKSSQSTDDQRAR